MISESQERMLAVVAPENVAAVEDVCRRWGLPSAVVAIVTDDGDVVVADGSVELARIPAKALASELDRDQARGISAAAATRRSRARRGGPAPRWPA